MEREKLDQTETVLIIHGCEIPNNFNVGKTWYIRKV